MVTKINYGDKFQLLAKEYNQTGNYRRLYEGYNKLNSEIMKDTSRYDYEADRWYNQNCNEICLEMLGDLPETGRVLSLGGGFWAEKELLDSVKAAEIIRTDIIASEGVEEQDAAALTYEANSFDIIICRELIEHVIDAQDVFTEIMRVLRPEGYLLITTPNAYSIAIDGVFHRRGFTPTSFLKELNEQGLTIVKTRGNVPYAFHGLKVYLQAGIDSVLDDFKEIDMITRDDEMRYYMGTQLFVLCKKVLR